MGFWGSACWNTGCLKFRPDIKLNCLWSCPEACEDYMAKVENESINPADGLCQGDFQFDGENWTCPKCGWSTKRR